MTCLSQYPSLIKDIAEHNCVFFIGAGVSECAGMPNGIALSEELAKDLIIFCERTNQKAIEEQIKIDSHNLEKIANHYQNLLDENQLKKRISEIIETYQKNADNEIYEIFTNLPRNDIISTNFDSLLETAFVSSKDYSVIWDDKHIVNIHAMRYNIFKIHGTFQEPTSIKILSEDFSKFKKSSLYKLLFSLFSTKTLVIVGYSLRDSDFHDIYNEANEFWPSQKIFIVTLNKNLLTHTVWMRKGAQVIEGGAENFFKDAVDSVSKYNQSTPPEEIKSVPKGEIKSEDQNPFKFYTTDGLMPAQFSELYHTFVPPEYSDFMKIYSIDKHHILQGGRGTGKTVILRGFSIENLLLNHIDTKFTGFWVPLSTMFLGCVKRQQEESDIFYFKFFASYLAILTIEKICDILMDCKEKNLLILDKDRENKFVNGVFNDLTINKNEQNLKSLYDEIYKIRTTYHLAYNRQTLTLKDPLYLRAFFKHLPTLHDYFKEKYFFVILDDAHFLDNNQKKVLVSFLSQREYPICFKIGSIKPFGIYSDFFGAIIQDGKDYETIYLDRVSGKKGFEDYKIFLEKLANNRLSAFKQDIRIKELLPEGYRKKGEFYSGFDTYAVLSSQIIRDFITLVKDTIYYAYPKIASEYVKLEVIPPNVQDEVIYAKSSIHLKEVDAAGELRDDMLLFIETLGKLFKQILEKSRQISSPKEIRTVSGIDIKNYHQLNQRTKAILDQALELQILQIPIKYRLRQKTETPIFGVKFHRLLIPYYRLKLGYRYPRQIEAKALNNIFDSPEKFIADLMKSWDSTTPESEIVAQMEIEYWQK